MGFAMGKMVGLPISREVYGDFVENGYVWICSYMNFFENLDNWEKT